MSLYSTKEFTLDGKRKKLFATHPQPTHTLAAAYSAAAVTT